MSAPRVYVGGRLGETPSCVATTLEEVMRYLAAGWKLDPERESYHEAWSCSFLDGEPYHLTCRLTVEDRTYYIEAFEVETRRATDPDDRARIEAAWAKED